MLLHIRTAFLFLSFIVFSLSSFSQAPDRLNASEIQLALKKLNVLGSVLYIAAHPDDENTKLITWFANEKLMNTAYLSLTRGDGGQNLIGPEIREALGVIRTHELLEARKIDGGQQFFTRANDFGFSKTPDETFSIWDRDKVLSDMVWVIRKFRPDIIITRFSSTPGGTHGHHTASAILAEEAFYAAADESKFPEQLALVDVWQPKRLLWNTTWWFYGDESKFDKSKLIPVEVGGYNPLLGKSYTEIAAVSRSMHSSQGFGTPQVRGSDIEYLEPIIGGNQPLFEGLDMTWARVAGGRAIQKMVDKIIATYDPEKPEKIAKDLVGLYKKLKAAPEGHWRNQKMQEVKGLIQATMGLYLEAYAKQYSASPREPVELTIEVTNRSNVDAELLNIRNNANGTDSTVNKPLANNHPLLLNSRFYLPADKPYSQPYWLSLPHGIGMYEVDDQEMIGDPVNVPPVTFDISLNILGEIFTYTIPLVYKTTDPAIGEVYRPFEVTPPVYMNLNEEVYIFPDEEPKNIQVLVGAGKDNVEGTLSLSVPEGWTVSPSSIEVSIPTKGRAQTFIFSVTAPSHAEATELKATFAMDGAKYSNSTVPLNYDHIAKQTLFPSATAKIVRLDVEKKGNRIGYIMGAGDNIPASLQQLGYRVDLLNDDILTDEKLKVYDAVILGVRAYNTIDKLRFNHSALMDYVKEGGTVIVQYNTNSRLVTKDLGPYPFSISRDRITVEDAPVRFLLPEHPILNYPNKITQADFDGWVQERGLYFPNKWSEEYETPISSNDPDEQPLDGGILVASYGKGYYIYTSYSWFRELPAGVPGAFRIFTNMISIGK